MNEQLALFADLTEPDEPEPEVELRADDGAPCSCRYCHTLTTARGIVTRGHGPGSPDCARLLAWGEAL